MNERILQYENKKCSLLRLPPVLMLVMLVGTVLFPGSLHEVKFPTNVLTESTPFGREYEEFARTMEPAFVAAVASIFGKIEASTPFTCPTNVESANIFTTEARKCLVKMSNAAWFGTSPSPKWISTLPPQRKEPNHNHDHNHTYGLVEERLEGCEQKRRISRLYVHECLKGGER